MVRPRLGSSTGTAQEGRSEVEVFADSALSGATRDRPGLNAMLDRTGEFNLVLAEALDRKGVAAV